MIMRDPEQIAADLEARAKKFQGVGRAALDREAAEALREWEGIAGGYELEANHFCRLHEEAEAERDALIAAYRVWWHGGSEETSDRAYAALPERVRQQIETEEP